MLVRHTITGVVHDLCLPHVRLVNGVTTEENTAAKTEQANDRFKPPHGNIEWVGKSSDRTAEKKKGNSKKQHHLVAISSDCTPKQGELVHQPKAREQKKGKTPSVYYILSRSHRWVPLPPHGDALQYLCPPPRRRPARS